MQKKSLLVALFCGALCLTGCLKNEESASVAQVRIAKANELNSIADLNKAKAAAEAVYAQAELTVAQAEAKLREANAALVLAQAETEKVRAELLKVKVALAEVKVEEEKVRLQMLEAGLEQKLAEVEAAVAMAEAEKQGWINVLNHAIADAERQAIADAEEILKAEDALEEYLLKQEGKKAAAVKKVSKQYFDALEQIQALQFQQIKTKAQKALVEAGALEVRDAIHFAIDQIDEEIAKKEALVEYLKEYQTMTPEEAEEALKAARTELSEAYTAYKAAVAMEDAADDALNGDTEKGITGIKKMTADYTLDWKKEFKDSLKKRVDYVEYPTFAWSKAYYGGHGEVDGVQYYGVYVADEEVDSDEWEFIPLWTTLGSYPNYSSWAAVKTERQRYPDIDVYEGKDKDFIVLENNTYVPAKIDFENVNDVLDGLVAEAKAAAQEEIDKEEKVNIPARIEGWQETIDAYEDELALHKQYVDARKAAVKAAEDEYIAAFKASKQHKQDIEDAWLAFRDYMLVNHDVDRMLFLSQNDSAKAYDAAKAAKNTAKDNLDAAKAALTESESALQTAKENEAKAEGEYWAAPGVPEATERALRDAEDHWNPKFNAATAKCENPSAQTGHTWASYNGDTKITGSEAKEVQNKLMNAKDSLKIWQDKEYDAQMALWRDPSNANLQTAFNTAKAKRVEYEGLVTSRQTDENTAANLYAEAKRNFDAADKKTAEKEKWNPAFEDYTAPTDFVTSNAPIVFPLTAVDTTGHLKKALSTTEAKWMKAGVVAGSSQGALIDALLEYNVNYARVNANTYPKSEQKTEKALLAEATAAEAKAKLQYEHATQKLIAAFKHIANWASIDLSKETIEDYLDENAITLWEAYQAAKKADEVDLEKAWQKVAFLYWYNPNHIDANPDPDYPTTWTDNANLWPNEKQAQYSWWRSSFYVDYEAQMLDKKTAEYYPIALKVFGQVKHHGEYVYVEDENGVQVKAENVWYWDYTLPDATFKFSAEEHIIPVAKCWASPSYQIEKYQSFIDGKDEYLAKFKEEVEAELKTTVEGIEAIRPKVNAYEAHEASYLAWIESISAYEAALNEAKKATFDAQQEVKHAQAIYDALDAVANGGIWVYDPDQTIFKKVYGHEATADEKAEGEEQIRSGDFTWITVNDEIERLEGNIEMISAFVGSQFIPIMIDAIADLNPAPANTVAPSGNGNGGSVAPSGNGTNGGSVSPDVVPSFEMFDSIAGLTFAKTLLQEALSKGKVALQVVIDAFDAELAVLDEKIDLYTKLAATYKGIMNALLGIVDEADVEGETAPVDGEGEGDDEE